MKSSPLTSCRKISRCLLYTSLVHILPHSLVVGVEDMCTVAVDVNALHRLRVDIACNVAALIEHKALLACLFCFLCKDRAIKAGTNDQVCLLYTSRCV